MLSRAKAGFTAFHILLFGFQNQTFQEKVGPVEKSFRPGPTFILGHQIYCPFFWPTGATSHLA